MNQNFFHEERKKISLQFSDFLSEIKEMTGGIPLKKQDFPLSFKLKEELKSMEMPNFEEILSIFQKTQERYYFYQDPPNLL